jgi:hypothetical protein
LAHKLILQLHSCKHNLHNNKANMQEILVNLIKH